MVGVPSSALIAFAAFVLALALDSYISSPHHSCSAFHPSASTHLTPMKFHNSDKNLISQTQLKMAPKSSDQSSAVEIDYSPAFQSLKNFVNTISKNSDSCQLVSSDNEDEIFYSGERNNSIIAINTIIFRPAEEDTIAPKESYRTYAVAIVPSSDKVDVRCLSEELSKIRKETLNGDTGNTIYNYDKWELAPSPIVQELCGFEPGTIPPLLVPSRKDGSSDPDMEGIQRPFATIIDSSLLWRINNTTMNKGNDSKDTTKQLLLGGGGSIDHRCLIDLNFLVKDVLEIDNDNSCQSDTRNAKIASIIRFDGGMSVNRDSIRGSSPSIANRYEENVVNTGIKKYPLAKKPFFQIAPPPGSVGSINPEESRKNHRPAPVTAIGRLTSVRQIAKKLVFADFAPPDYDYNEWLINKNANSSTFEKNYDKNEKGMPGPPWRSGEDGKDMYVQIIVGKTFCERYEDGMSRLKNLKPGKLVLVRGAANVDPMQKNGWRNSSGNWAQKRSLDVIVSSFEILDEDDSDDSLRMLVEEAQREVASRGTSNANWNSLLPWERKNDFQRRAVGGAAVANSVTESEEDGNYSTSPSDYNKSRDSGSMLTLKRFNSHLQDVPLDITIVDDADSIMAMANDIKDLFSTIDKKSQKIDVLDYIAGIDCEWRPTGAYAEALLGGADDNPVALMQICLPAIGKVYLVDTYRMLRPNLAEIEEMNEIEAIFSEIIGTLFDSETMIKAGYSVGVDFRRLAASFPHMPCFRSVRSVVELSTLAERLHPKSARPWLGSLQKLTKLVLGYDIAKEQQCSDWESRPLTQSQIEYATLDCALPPRLVDEMAEGSGNARIREVLPGVAKSWRFQTIDGSQKDAIRRLKAKRIVSNTFLVSQSWLNSSPAPDPISIPEEGGGPYTDTDGVLKMPADLVSIGDNGAVWKSMSGKAVGGKKNDCIDLLVGNAVPQDAILDYNPRSGFISFQDGLALFVNMPDPSRPSRRRMPYPNEWLEGGKFLTWYIRKNDWDNGNSEVAKLLSGSNENGDAINTSSSVVLFVRIGTRDFVCCGSCTASVADDDNPKSNKKLVKLNLRLNDWETIKDETAFSQLLDAAQPKKNSTRKQDPASIQNDLAHAVVNGNIVGAFSMALDASNISPTERSIAEAVRCTKEILQHSNNPLALQAKEILDNIM